MDNPDVFTLDKISNDYITNRKRKFDCYLKECYFKLPFNSFSPPVKISFLYNVKLIHLKGYLLY